MLINRPGGIGTGRSGSMRVLQKTNRSLSKILEKLSTGLRINRASDDAAGLSISEQLRTQVRGFKMADRNVTDAMSALNIADGTGREVTAILQRQRELAVQSRNDTLSDDDRAALDAEYQQLTEELGRISDAAQFNTRDVASGEGLASGTAQVQAGPNSGDAVTMPAIDMGPDTLNVTGTSIDTSANAATAMDRVDEAIRSINSQRSAAGAMTNRFESTQNNLAVARTNTQAAESVLRDQDMAAGLAALTRDRLLQEGGLHAMNRFNEISANHLLGLLQ